MKRTSVHIKNMWIKQLCNHMVWDFATVFRVRKLFGTFEKRAPACPKLRNHRSWNTSMTLSSRHTLTSLFSFIVELYLVARSDSDIWLVKFPLIYQIYVWKKSFSVNEDLLTDILTNKILELQTVRFVIGNEWESWKRFCCESASTFHNFFIIWAVKTFH